MVISNEERAVLLKRLEKAREAKVKKQQEAKEAKEAQQKAPAPPQVPSAAPVVELEPIEEEVEEEIALPPKVAVAKKAKKIVPMTAPESSSDEEDQKPVVKKSKGVKEKKMPYMKLKLYREPSNPVAFQSLLENLNAEYEEEAAAPAPAQPPNKPPRVLVQQGVKTEVQSKKINDARALALSFFS